MRFYGYQQFSSRVVVKELEYSLSAVIIVAALIYLRQSSRWRLELLAGRCKSSFVILFFFY